MKTPSAKSGYCEIIGTNTRFSLLLLPLARREIVVRGNPALPVLSKHIGEIISISFQYKIQYCPYFISLESLEKIISSSHSLSFSLFNLAPSLCQTFSYA